MKEERKQLHWMIDYTLDGEINGQFRTSTVNFNLNLTNLLCLFAVYSKGS